jgi:predicted nuclease of predicted toxin-antitoxin system
VISITYQSIEESVLQELLGLVDENAIKVWNTNLVLVDHDPDLHSITCGSGFAFHYVWIRIQCQDRRERTGTLQELLGLVEENVSKVWNTNL